MAHKVLHIQLSKLFKNLSDFDAKTFDSEKLKGSTLKATDLEGYKTDAYHALIADPGSAIEGVVVPDNINKKEGMQEFLEALLKKRQLAKEEEQEDENLGQEQEEQEYEQQEQEEEQEYEQQEEEHSDEYMATQFGLEDLNPDVKWTKYLTEDNIDDVNELLEHETDSDDDKAAKIFKYFNINPNTLEPMSAPAIKPMSVPAIKPAPAPSAVLVKPPLPLLPVKKQIIIPSKSLAPVAVTAKLPALPAYPTFSTTSAKTMSKNTDKCNLSNISFLVENGRLSTVKYRVGNICPSADLDVPVTNNPFVLVINLHTCLSLIFPVVLRFNSGRTILDIVKSIVTVIVAVNKDNFCGDKLAQGHASYVMNDVYINPNKNIVTITVKPI